jgi:glutamate 5-kinase
VSRPEEREFAPESAAPREGGRPRALLAEARRVVVKIGSKSIARGEAPGAGRFAQVAAQVARARQRGQSVVLVSSGAIALGFERLGLGSRPQSIALLQASAAAGQSQLMRAYEDAFAAHQLPVAQILLTHADLAERDRYLNARAALEALVGLGAVPIINENDTVSVEEIKFGDNDQLAGMVATLVGAELLVLLTDVEGLLDANGARVPLVADVGEAASLVRATTSDVGTGGMASKLASARAATRRGVPVVIADARDPEILDRIVRGEDVGTLFLPQGTALASRKHWIGFTLKPRGALIVDEGAARAVSGGDKSLLSRGVVGVRGDFEAGDPVSIVGPDGAELARGSRGRRAGRSRRDSGARAPQRSCTPTTSSCSERRAGRRGARGRGAAVAPRSRWCQRRGRAGTQRSDDRHGGVRGGDPRGRRRGSAACASGLPRARATAYRAQGRRASACRGRAAWSAPRGRAARERGRPRRSRRARRDGGHA